MKSSGRVFTSSPRHGVVWRPITRSWLRSIEHLDVQFWTDIKLPTASYTACRAILGIWRKPINASSWRMTPLPARRCALATKLKQGFGARSPPPSPTTNATASDRIRSRAILVGGALTSSACNSAMIRSKSSGSPRSSSSTSSDALHWLGMRCPPLPGLASSFFVRLAPHLQGIRSPPARSSNHTRRGLEHRPLAA